MASLFICVLAGESMIIVVAVLYLGGSSQRNNNSNDTTNSATATTATRSMPTGLTALENLALFCPKN